MHRILSAIAIAASAVGAATLCTDTLYLSGMRQLDMSFKDLSFKTTNKDKFDTTDIDIRQAGRAKSLSMAPEEDTSIFTVPVQFRSNCGNDSTSEVSFLEYSNYGYKQRGSTYWKDTSRTYTSAAKVLSYPDGVTYDAQKMAGFWTVDNVQIGMLQGGVPSVYHIQCVGFRYVTGGGYSFSRFSTLYRAERGMALKEVNHMLDLFSGAMDSIGKGFDSVRVRLRLTESKYSYDPTTWAYSTGVRPRAVRHQAFTGHRTANGYVFVLPRPVELTIHSPEGRIVRTLPASTTSTWDGRDAAGHKVSRGVYLVRGLGLGVLSIAAP